MLQTIGLIVAVYAIVRLCQTSLEHAAYEVRHRNREINGVSS